MAEEGRMVEEEYSRVLLGGQRRLRSVEHAASWERGCRVPCAVFFELIFLLIISCSPGDESPPRPPEPFLSFMGEVALQVTSPAPGLAYYDIRNEDEPWAVHLLRVDLSRCELGLQVLEAPAGNGKGDGRSRVTELLAASDGKAVAGVNGDFFTPEGRPLGTEVVGGEVRSIRDRPAFAWNPQGDPWMGLPETRGDSILVLGWELARPEGDGKTQVIGGFPLLLQDGHRVGDLGIAQRPSFAAERHPRTAVGFDSDGGILWVVVVDGRQPERSMGMSLPELAGLLEALGIEQAINLDGGGSSVMVVGGRLVSSPSDADGERAVGNALAVRRDSTLCILDR